MIKLTYRSYRSYVALTLLGAALGAAGCSGDDHAAADRHSVYFVGYVYDGARGIRLKGAEITSINIKYRDKTIATTIEADGRYVTTTALPTWQDYDVYIVAPNYRPFVSRNPGFDIPNSLAMTNDLATASTTQTFEFDAFLFTDGILAPKVVINVEKSDAATAGSTTPRAAGTLRLRPQTSSLIAGEGTTASVHRWSNDEDLLTQTLIKPFMNGRVEINEGELTYGVLYEIAIFDVKGYQPVVLAAGQSLLAGAVTSRSVTLPKEARDPLRVLATSADACRPPAPTATDFGAAIDITFTEEIEAVGNLVEDIDNGVAVSVIGVGGNTCQLNNSTDATKQERGTRVLMVGNVLSLAFNPSIGFAKDSPFGGTCNLPTSITSVVYSNLGLMSLQPKGDPTRKRNLGTMLADFAMVTMSAGNTLYCPPRSSGF